MGKYSFFKAIQYIKKDISFTSINIIGLSLGISLILIAILWVKYEYSYDRFHKYSDRIYRVVAQFNSSTDPDDFPYTPGPLGEAIKSNIPEVIDYVRFGGSPRIQVRSGENLYYENIKYADPSIFKIFSFEIKSQNGNDILDKPNSIIISESKSKQYFGNTSPIGQMLMIGYDKISYIITGVMKDIPKNSQLQIDFLASLLPNPNDWEEWNYGTYILVTEAAVQEAINNKLKEFSKTFIKREDTQLYLQQLTRIHLFSDLRNDLDTNRSFKVILIFVLVCSIVTIIACFNYINLAIARNVKRGKEIALRKIAGASRLDIFYSFFLESLVFAIVAICISILLCILLIPNFNSILHVPLSSYSLFKTNMIPIYTGIAFLISFISGGYPSFVISSINPLAAINDSYNFVYSISIKGFRRLVVIIQFVMTVMLIGFSIIIHSQLTFILNKDIGLDHQSVLLVPIYQDNVKKNYELFKNELLKNPYIENVSAVSYKPGTRGYRQSVWWEGMPENDFSNTIDWIPVDQDFLKTLRIELVKGEFFSANIAEISSIFYVLNESAVKKIGWDEPIGKTMDLIGKGEVIGVVKDFNFKSLYNNYESIVLAYYPEVFDYLLVKLISDNIPKSLDYIKCTWQAIFPKNSFDYSFLTDDYKNLYSNEINTSKIFDYISFLALFLSFIGLIGLVLLTIEKRTKEISIRKIAGASFEDILIKFNLDFIIPILISIIIAIPIVFHFMKDWLQNFAFRTELHWWLFAFPGLITILLSTVIVSIITWKILINSASEYLKRE